MAANPNALETKPQKEIKTPRPLHASTMENTPNYSEKFKSIIQGNQKTNARIPYTGHSSSSYNPSYLKQGSSQPALRRPRSSTYKSTTVSMFTEYDVLVCNIENGPKLFSVQLMSSQDQLKKMMLDLENIPLVPLDNCSIGTACLARYSYDLCLYRAVITAIHSSGCSVAYIDYGHSEKVASHNLFVIPENFLEHNTFSIKFSLSGSKSLDLTPQIKTKFRDLVLLQEVKLKVTPMDGPPLYQYCELYLNGKNVLEILQNSFSQNLRYRDPDPLQNNEMVIVRYLNSPRDFFVQKLSTLEKFEKLMDMLNLYCKNHGKPLAFFKKGLPCALLYEENYYRGEIVSEFSHGDTVQVSHVDFGYTHMIQKKNVFAIPSEVTMLPRQAIHCILKGFEGDDSIIRESVITQFEMLSEKSNGDRSEFYITVFKQCQNGSFLVNLKSEEGLDLMKKLYKLSQPFNKYIDLEKKEQQLQMNSTSTSTDINETLENENNRNRQPNGSNRIVREPINANARVAFESRNSSISSSNEKSVDVRRDTPYRNVNNNVVEQQPQMQQFRKPSVQDRLNLRDANFNHQQSEYTAAYKTNGHHQNGAMINEEMPSIENTEEFVSFETPFPVAKVPLNSIQSIKISWWFSPFQFYVMDRNNIPQLDLLTKQLQAFYKNKTHVSQFLKPNTFVVVFNRNDKNFYRGKIIANNALHMKYRVFLVDAGLLITVLDKEVYQVEKRFTQIPEMVKLCSLKGIISNVENLQSLKNLEGLLSTDNDVRCEFLEHDEKTDCYIVNLTSKGKSVIEEMRNKGLWSVVGNNIDLSFLSLQQIRATVESVESFLNFKIKIEGFEFPLMCSYDDIRYAKESTNKIDEFRKYYEKKSFVFNVTNVTGDKIIMLRPLSKLFHPDEPSYICRYPLVCNEFNARVVHVEDHNKVFVQLIEDEAKIVKLNDDMFEYYENGGKTIAAVKEQQICAAKSFDGNWYRAKVTKIYPTTDKVQVFYFDFGNLEDVEKSNIKHIENDFCLFSSALAIELLLPIGKRQGDEKTVILNEIKSLTDNVVLKVKILDYFNNRFVSDLTTETGYRVLDTLIAKGLIQGQEIELIRVQYSESPVDFYEFIETVDLTKDEEEVVKKNPAPKEPVTVLKVHELNSKVPEPAPVPVQVQEAVTVEEPPQVVNLHADKTEAFLSHCDNPGKFFLQLSKDMNGITQLQENLQIIAGSLPPLMRIVNGADCICNYIVDQQWYRAKILDSELLVIQFIDFGNTDALSEQDIKDIKEPIQTEREPFCSRYSLPIIPKDTLDWSDEANKIFNDSYDKPCYFEIIAKGEKKTFINLFIDNVNVADYLIEKGFAKPMETIPSGVECFVSHINSLSDFYVQLESDSQGMTLMESFLAGFEKFNKISEENYKEGMICAALFPEDGNWYRAQILSKTPDGYKVLYIDYGNTEMTNEIRELTPDIAQLPFLAKKCSLRLPRELKSWSDEAEAKFSDIAALGQTVFVVELKEPGEHVTVDLFVDNKNIIEDLEALCEKRSAESEDILNSSISTSFQISINEPDFSQPIEAVISNINAPYEFYIQLSSSLPKIDQINEVISNLPNQEIEIPILGTVVGVFYPQLNRYLRGLINSRNEDGLYSIFFIDYGVEILAPREKLKTLSADIKLIEPLAIKCSLENDKSFRENSESIEKFKDLAKNYERVVIKIVDKDQKPWIIKAFGNEENLCEKLNKSLGGSVFASEDLSQDKLFTTTFIESADEIYIQDEEQARVNELIIDQLNANPDALEDLTSPKLGDRCVAFFDEDQTFYRAEITESADGGKFKVHFIDFGNYAYTDRLKKLPPSVTQLPVCCQRCSVKTDDTQFLTTMDRHFGEKFQINRLASSGDIWTIEILFNGVNIADENQKSSGEKQSTEPANNLVNSFKKCRIIYELSPNDFYVNFVEELSVIDSITEMLLVSESFDKLENPSIKDYCIAKFEEDGAYYRAQVINIDQNGIEVLFIDYGNVAIAKDLRVIPENDVLKNVSTAAKHCGLQNLTEVDFWSQHAQEVFAECVAPGFNETFQIEILQTHTDPWIVRLYYNDVDIAKEMIRKMQEPSKDLDSTDVIVDEVVKEITELDTENSLILHSKDIEMNNIHCSSGHGSMDVTPTS